MEILAFEFYDLILDSGSVFCKFSHLSHPKKPVQKSTKGLLGERNAIPLGLSFIATFFPLVNDRQPTYLAKLVKMKFHLD